MLMQIDPPRTEVCSPAVGARSVWVASWSVISPRIQRDDDVLLAVRSQRTQPASPCTLSSEQLQQASGLVWRDLKKLDRFSVLALAAARSALDRVDLNPEQRLECGVINGNMTAGWTFTEPQLRALYQAGLAAVSPYLATAWFPAAPQGQITIHLKLRGFAKTITTDRCAGAQAIGIAFDHIRSGASAFLLAGGVEAPVTPFVQAVPPSVWARGEMCEAAAYLLLSSELQSGLAITAHETLPVPSLEASLGALLQNWLREFRRLIPDTIQDLLVVCNVPSDRALEDAMRAVTRVALGVTGEQVVFPTRWFGDTLAASGAIAAALACAELAASPIGRGALVLSLGHQCCDLLFITKLHHGVETPWPPSILKKPS